MVAVLLVSTYWGLGLGLLTALASALAFNFFHTPPTGHFTIANAQNYVALGVFLIAAAIASTVAELARSRAREAERRSEEADLAAELARLLLGGRDLRDALGPRRIAWPRRSTCRRWRWSSASRRRSAAPRPAAGNRRRPGGDPAGLCLDRPRDPGAPARSSRAGARGAAGRRPRSRRPAGRGRGDAGAAPLGLGQDGAVASRLARPAHAADHDRRGQRRGSLAEAQLPGARGAWRGIGQQAGACRGWSTSCSTSRGWRPGRPTRGASGARSRRSSRGRRGRRASGRPVSVASTPTCR